MQWSVDHLVARLRGYSYRLQYPVSDFRLYLQCVSGKSGLEIGGPSAVFREKNALPLYDSLGSLDNCDFSSTTVWANHRTEFVYSPVRPPGSSFFCDGSNLVPIGDRSYDFILSAHNLEHFANPVKALSEWKRVLRPGGTLVLVLPNYRKTFDHRRTPTPVAAMLADFEQNVGEEDLSHLPEILALHDLKRDRAAGTFAEFKTRSFDNFNNRCLHHHVFDENNSRELLSALDFQVLTVNLAPPFHLSLLARMS
jgi:SAM-dependent methyltransferase